MDLRYQASAPGSIMLLGEHAVLHGYKAIACAVNQRLTVNLQPRDDENIIINSATLGTYSSTLKNLTISKPFDYILCAVKQYQNQIDKGFTLSVTTEFSHQIGLGSSAACTVACVAVLNQWLGRRLDEYSLFYESLNVIHKVQGVGSGTDIAASIFGGVIAFASTPLNVKKLTHFPKLTLVYAGYKTATVEVIKKVASNRKNFPEIYAHLFACIGSCAEAGQRALENKDDQTLGKIFFLQQQLMEALEVSDDTLRTIIKILSSEPINIAAKISGSGLGDCVVALGQINENLFLEKLAKNSAIEIINVEISDQGIHYANP